MGHRNVAIPVIIGDTGYFPAQKSGIIIKTQRSHSLQERMPPFNEQEAR